MEDQNIRDAQYRKSLSISFFNATNNAIEIVKMRFGMVNLEPGSGESKEAPEVVRKMIVTWRDWLLKEHAEYYAKTIAAVGVPYVPQATIDKLKEAKTIAELKKKWVQLSQDERDDKVIIKAVADIKKSLLKKPKVEGEKKQPAKKEVKQNEKPRQHKAGKPRVAPHPKG